jgi:arginase
MNKRPSALIRAPSNLGLRPPLRGGEPGTWRAPAALTEAGLLKAFSVSEVLDLPRPPYSPDAQPGTRLRNGPTLRAFNLELADAVERFSRAARFPLVIGGDCSVLLGALAGARRLGPLSLVHVDGHSDFRHPGNYDPQGELGSVGGMDLALATGRGETLMTEWPGVAAPLVPDAQVIQLGEREGRDADWAWPDIKETAIRLLEIHEVKANGADWALAQILQVIARQPEWPFWVHFDVDVLDQSVMPAVDSPGSPGIQPHDLRRILRTLVHEPRCAGMTMTIFDPDLDPNGVYASLLVRVLADVFR